MKPTVKDSLTDQKAVEHEGIARLSALLRRNPHGYPIRSGEMGQGTATLSYRCRQLVQAEAVLLAGPRIFKAPHKFGIYMTMNTAAYVTVQHHDHKYKATVRDITSIVEYLDRKIAAGHFAVVVKVENGWPELEEALQKYGEQPGLSRRMH